MSNVAKRINIVSIKMVKESSFLYQTRQILSPSDAYEMIKEQLEGLDREQFIIACLNTKNEPTNISVVSLGTLNKAIVHQYIDNIVKFINRFFTNRFRTVEHIGSR